MSEEQFDTIPILGEKFESLEVRLVHNLSLSSLHSQFFLLVGSHEEALCWFVPPFSSRLSLFFFLILFSLPSIYLDGWVADDVSQQRLRALVNAVLQKPDQLRRAVRDIVAQSQEDNIICCVTTMCHIRLSTFNLMTFIHTCRHGARCSPTRSRCWWYGSR